MDEWEASETNNLHQRFSSFPHLGEKAQNRCYSFPTRQPPVRRCSHRTWCCCHALNLFYFLLISIWKIHTTSQWVAHSLPPDHSPGCWQLSWIQQLLMLGEKTLGKEAKLPFWRSLWEPLHVGCSCWHSRESGKIVVNPQDKAAASCHHPLAAGGDNPGQGGTHAVQELCHSLD